MCFCRVGIPHILCGLKIIKYVQNLDCISRQNDLQSSHIVHMTNLSVLYTDYTIAFATFMLRASLEHSKGRAASLAHTNGFLIRGALLVVRETHLAPKMSITFAVGNYDGGKVIWSPSHTIATRLVTAVCGISCAQFVTRFTHKPLRHRARYIHDHVIVPFDIVIEYINSLRIVDLPFKHCIHTPGLDRQLSYTPENVLGI